MAQRGVVATVRIRRDLESGMVSRLLRRFLRASICLLAMAVCSATLAVPAGDENSEHAENNERVEEIVVSSRIGPVDQHVVVVDKETIDANLHGVDVLRSLPGLALSTAGNRGSLAQARLRGAEANHLLVLIDGVAVNNPATGAEFDFGTLDTAGIRRAELLAGPQSAVWGSDALAGVLYLDSAPAEERRRVSLGRGSHGTVDADLELAAANASGFASLNIGLLESEGTNAALQGDERDGFANKTAHLRAGRQVAGWVFSSTARWVSATADFDPSPAPAFVPADGDRQARNRLALLHGSVRFAGWPRFEPQLTVSTVHTGLRSLSAGVLDTTYVGRRDTATVAGNVLLRRQRFNIMAEAKQERFEQSGAPTPFGDPNQKQRAATVSAASEYQVDFRHVAFTVSVRRDFNDQFAHALAYRIGATTRSNPRWFASAGRGVKNPTFIERFGYTPDTFFGNPRLRPEISIGGEAGVAWTWRNASFALAAFDNTLRQEIDGFAFDTALGGFTARNLAGKSKRRGAEASLDARWNCCRLRISYSRVDATDGTGKRELRRPRHLADLSLQGRLAPWLSAGFGILHNGAVADRDYSTFPATDVTLQDFRLLRFNVQAEPSSRWRVALLLDNVLDANYAAAFGYRSPGLSALARLSLAL